MSNGSNLLTPSPDHREGRFDVSVRQDDAGHIQSITIANDAIGGVISESDDGAGATATLFIRYVDRVTEVFVYWDAIDFTSDSVQLHHIIDGGHATVFEWSVSTTGSGTFYPGNHVQFIKQLIGANTLLVGTDLDGKVTGAIFDLNGIEEAIVPLRDAGGFWRVSQRADPFDDSVVTTLVVDSDDLIGGDYPALVLRYGGERHEAYIVWGVDIGYDEPVDVRYRIGGQPSECDAWGISTDQQATFYGGDVRRLIRYLTESEQFLAGVTPYRSNPIIARFDLRGLPAIVGLLG